MDAFFNKQHVLTAAGINATKTRLAYFFANLEHESGGFTIKNLTENTNYTAQRMAAVWPNRFSSASAVIAKYGSLPGWQARAFGDIYGNRMGNRPNTNDGFIYIGRGGPQWTGRDGYENLERLTGIPVVAHPYLASQPDRQPEVCAAFWSWKKLNAYADKNDFNGLVRVWNGGTNGMADRLALMRGNDPIIDRLAVSGMYEEIIPNKSTIIPPPTSPAAPIPYSFLQSVLSGLAQLFRKKS